MCSYCLLIYKNELLIVIVIDKMLIKHILFFLFWFVLAGSATTFSTLVVREIFEGYSSQYEMFQKQMWQTYNQILLYGSFINKCVVNVYDPRIMVKYIQYTSSSKTIQNKGQKVLKILQSLHDIEDNDNNVYISKFIKLKARQKQKKLRIYEVIQKLYPKIENQHAVCYEQLLFLQHKFIKITKILNITHNTFQDYYKMQSSLINCGIKHFAINILQLIEKLYSNSYYDEGIAILGEDKINAKIEQIEQIVLEYRSLMKLQKQQSKQNNISSKILSKRYLYHRKLQISFDLLSNIIKQVQNVKNVEGAYSQTIMNNSNNVNCQPLQLTFSVYDFFATLNYQIPSVKKINENYEFQFSNKDKTTLPKPYQVKGHLKQQTQQTIKQKIFETLKIVNDVLNGVLFMMA